MEAYDKELQMWREKEKSVSLAKLRFLRWLIEQGRLEHEVFGQPSGEFAREAQELVAA